MRKSFSSVRYTYSLEGRIERPRLSEMGRAAAEKYYLRKEARVFGLTLLDLSAPVALGAPKAKSVPAPIARPRPVEGLVEKALRGALALWAPKRAPKARPCHRAVVRRAGEIVARFQATGSRWAAAQVARLKPARPQSDPGDVRVRAWKARPVVKPEEGPDHSVWRAVAARARAGMNLLRAGLRSLAARQELALWLKPVLVG